VKLQTYQPETICADGDDQYCKMKDGPWAGFTLRELYTLAHTPREWHHTLFMEARRLGLQVWSTPFCPDDVDFLETLDCPRYKVSSFDIVNVPLLDRIKETNKPVILSTGMADAAEIKIAAGRFPIRREVTLLHCISQYPATAEAMNMRHMRSIEHLGYIGLSDHSLSDTAAIMAVAMGATMIEKHLCLSRAEGGPDSGFSLEPLEFARLVKSVREAEAAMYPQFIDTTNAYLRPSLWLVKDIGPAEILSAEHVRVLRPGNGLPPYRLSGVIGKQSMGTYKANTPLDESMFV
jgi:sialic acid synthase SpsE